MVVVRLMKTMNPLSIAAVFFIDHPLHLKCAPVLVHHIKIERKVQYLVDLWVGKIVFED
jgi:hypothetical protein